MGPRFHWERALAVVADAFRLTRWLP